MFLGYGLVRWIAGVLGAFSVGVSKTGIAGLGILAVAVFALGFPGKDSPGIVLPILIAGDVIAVNAYRKHADWSHLWGLYPWAGAGVVLGAIAMKAINSVPPAMKAQSNVEISRLIGVILVMLILIQIVRKVQTARAGSAPPKNRAYAAVMGLLAGFTTMVANAAGPIMVLYLLASGLPTMQFMGTGAWFFFTVNCLKVPFSMFVGIMTRHTLEVSAILIPFSVLGALYGKRILERINQDTFENVALVLTILAGLKLLATR